MVNKGFIRTIKDMDDLVKIITGKRIPNLVQRAVELLNEKGPQEAVLERLDVGPHVILGIRKDAGDIVVKAAFRALAKQYHPDTGTNPDPKKFQQAAEAYELIMKERKDGGQV